MTRCMRIYMDVVSMIVNKDLQIIEWLAWSQPFNKICYCEMDYPQVK